MGRAALAWPSLLNKAIEQVLKNDHTPEQLDTNDLGQGKPQRTSLFVRREFHVAVAAGLCEFAKQNHEFGLAFRSEIDSLARGECLPDAECTDLLSNRPIPVPGSAIAFWRGAWIVEMLRACPENLLLTQLQSALPKYRPDEKKTPQLILFGRRLALVDGDLTVGHCHYQFVAEMPVIYTRQGPLDDFAVSTATNAVIAQVVRRYPQFHKQADPEFLNWLFGDRSLARYRSDIAASVLEQILHDSGLACYSDDASGVVAVQPTVFGSLPREVNAHLSPMTEGEADAS
ncbi:MAG: hypothetical protein AAFX06_32700 [Planctomycetota bacterium]